MATVSEAHSTAEKRHRSVFELPESFFDSCALLPSPHSIAPDIPSKTAPPESADEIHAAGAPRLTCNICKSEFDSLQDQRLHFKSDIHRFNVKLSLTGKSTVKEDDFDEFTPDSFKEYDVSSISGSEDEAEKEAQPRKGLKENLKQKLFVRLRTGERVSVWKCLVMNESEDVLSESDEAEKDIIGRLERLVREPRDKTRLRIVLLASGGHFAGCVFDGNSVVAHKTFHRYVVRAKAGKKQSSKDASGRAAHSAGASLRRYNELALKKEIQELLAVWKPYFDASLCVLVNAPSNNRQLLYNSGKPCFSHQNCDVRVVPLTARRPTFKEARRLYDQLTQITHELDEKEVINSHTENNPLSDEGTSGNCKEMVADDLTREDISLNHPSSEVLQAESEPGENERKEIPSSTLLHEAAQSNDAEKVLELLEKGLDPCATDERGRTPYTLVSEKEVRNTFRRFMALNLDKWDWHAAKVPSALTKEMEDSQAAKQAEKDAKRKAKAKELKKLRKEKEKKAQAEAATMQKASKASQDQGTSSVPVKGQPQPSSIVRLSKEEELKRQQAIEREKRAAAAERRIAGTSANNSLAGSNIFCSCCNVSLAGKVPFHRYNYRYCSSSCMHVHKEMLEDG